MRKAIAVTVPQEKTEQMLKLLRELRLVEKSLQFGRTKDTVTIPLTRKPFGPEIAGLMNECPEAKIHQADFAEIEKKPRSLQEALAGSVPEEFMGSLPRSYDIIGEIAVVDLPEGLDLFTPAIGKAILTINPQVRLVLRKASKVAGRFRTRSFDIIAGSGSTETFYREYSCIFNLDVAKVYFSPRLSHERARVASQVKEGECVVDMFAGVGPYSILIAKTQHRSKVYSIDINPEAYRYLRENVLRNGVADRVIPILSDVREITVRDLRGTADRVIMNLPSQSKEFLDVALHLLKSSGGTVHYYAFVSRDVSGAELKKSFESTIAKLGRKIVSVPFAKMIKEVAPYRFQAAMDANIA